MLKEQAFVRHSGAVDWTKMVGNEVPLVIVEAEMRISKVSDPLPMLPLCTNLADRTCTNIASRGPALRLARPQPR